MACSVWTTTFDWRRLLSTYNSGIASYFFFFLRADLSPPRRFLFSALICWKYLVGARARGKWEGYGYGSILSDVRVRARARVRVRVGICVHLLPLGIRHVRFCLRLLRRRLGGQLGLGLGLGLVRVRVNMCVPGEPRRWGVITT